MTSVSVDGGSSFINATSGMVEAVVSGGTAVVVETDLGAAGSIVNSGTMVASANGGQGHISGPPVDIAVLFVNGATVTNNKTILGAATSGGSTFVEVDAGAGLLVNKGVISGSANSGSETFLEIFGSSVVNSKTIAAQATVFSEVEVEIAGSSITNTASASIFAGAASGSETFLLIETFISNGTFTNSGAVTVSASASSEGELVISGGTVTNAKTIQVVANGQSMCGSSYPKRHAVYRRWWHRRGPSRAGRQLHQHDLQCRARQSHRPTGADGWRHHDGHWEQPDRRDCGQRQRCALWPLHGVDVRDFGVRRRNAVVRSTNGTATAVGASAPLSREL